MEDLDYEFDLVEELIYVSRHDYDNTNYERSVKTLLRTILIIQGIVSKLEEEIKNEV
jgi:hypothetical protein